MFQLLIFFIKLYVQILQSFHIFLNYFLQKLKLLKQLVNILDYLKDFILKLVMVLLIKIMNIIILKSIFH